MPLFGLKRLENVLSGMNPICIKAVLFIYLWWFTFLKSLILLPQNVPFYYAQVLRIFHTLLTRAQLETNNLTVP